MLQIFSPNKAAQKKVILTKPKMLEKAILCELFFRSHLLLISTYCIPLEQLVSHSHLNYTLYFFLQTIPDSFVFPSISSFLETWPFSQCIHECKHFQFLCEIRFYFWLLF